MTKARRRSLTTRSSRRRFGVRLNSGVSRRPLPNPGWLTRRRLKKALSHYREILELNPANWRALIIGGKIHQRLGSDKAALEWFEAARFFVPANRSVAKEVSAAAIELDNPRIGVRAIDFAILVHSGDAALHQNLGVCYILLQRAHDAVAEFETALTLDPDDHSLRCLQSIAVEIQEGRRQCPRNREELDDAVRRALAGS